MNTLLWFLGVVAVSWLVILYVLPFLGRLFLRRLSKKFNDRMENYQHNETQPEGSVTIENIPKTTEKKTDFGDYVNYEEINEK